MGQGHTPLKAGTELLLEWQNSVTLKRPHWDQLVGPLGFASPINHFESPSQ